MRSRAFSLAELLVSTAITLILLLAVGNAIVMALRVQAFQGGRAAIDRTATLLSERLSEEARSSTAVFVPTTDVLGYPNSGGAGAHEVDFFRRLSAGGDEFVAYRFESSAGQITRYEYSLSSGTKTILTSDLAADRIAAFALALEKASDITGAVGVSDPEDVSIYYGTPELVGGNGVVIATLQQSSDSGAPGQTISVHLASRVAPTAVAVLAPKPAPTPPHTTTVIPFILLRPGVGPVHGPHGPIHGGSPGGPPSLIHGPSVPGIAEFYGPGSSASGTWLELSSRFPLMMSGVYTVTLPDGSDATIVISCKDGPCPLFAPVPVSAPGLTPPGGVAFHMEP